MFLLGGTPALLVAFVRYGVREPARWVNRAREMGQRLTARSAFCMLFSPEYRRRTILNAIYVLVSMVGLWAGSVYVPTAITQLVMREERTIADAARLASIGSVLLSVGTIAGCLLVPVLARFTGRRYTLGFFYAVMAAFVILGFGYVFYLPQHAVPWFMACLFFLGVGGASFCVFTVWLPEQYRTECRASAFAFSTSFGRFIAAGATFAVGSAVAHFGTLGRPVAMTGLVFVAGLLIVPFGFETRGTKLSD
jgi:MFS family permease